MTIPEACQLILQAGALASENCVEIYLLDMGTPIKINDMARDLIRLSGFEPEVDIKIEYIGLRPGEKLYEELITEGEGIVSTSHDKILALRGQEFNQELMNGKIDELMALSKNQDTKNIKRKLKEIVPEYRPE
jgi:FlaA1/EpsC-like NDP-sugar epimerase